MKRAAPATLAFGAMLLAASISGCAAGNDRSASSAVSPSAARPSTSASASAAAAAAVEQATVETTKTGKLGTVLASGKGRTLYLFEADRSANSTCYAACAAAWPPFLTSGTPKAGSGVKSNLLKTSRRDNGATQVVYNGHPLYLFAGDSNPGDTNGQGLNQFGAKWYALDTGGNKVDKS
jgi:predicted lipoprotein with Yx(FWY)xxD motif